MTNGNPTLAPSHTIPKQYGSVSQTHHTNTTTTEPAQDTDALEDSDTSSNDEETLREVSHL